MTAALFPLFAALLAAGAPAADQRPLDTKRVLDEVDFVQKLGDRVPLDLVFRDESGQEVELGELFDDRPVMLALVYYECPMLCTLILNDVLRCVRAMPLDAGPDYRIVAVSIDPNETSELAARKRETFLEAYGREDAEDGWTFLVGDEPNIRALADAVGFRYALDPETGEYAHAAGITLLTPEGVLSRYFYGLEYPTRDVRLGLVEAADGKLGSLVDRALLFCFHYDPTTGKYGLVIMNVLRLAAGLTVVVLFGSVYLWLRRERKGSSGRTPAESPA